MKKGKTASTNRGRNFNIVLTVVALVLILAVGGFATYSWVDKSTSLDIEMNGDIQRVPNGNKEYYHQVSLVKGNNSEISLNNYLDKASDMMLSPVSSADGINFFMQKDAGNNSFIRSGSNSDRNVNYISFDFDVTSSDETNISFDNESIPSFTFGNNTNQLKSVRVAIQVNNEIPMIFSQDGIEYSAIATDEEGNITTKKITPKKFGDYTFGKRSLFNIPQSTEANKIKTKVRITIWIEGTDSNLPKEYAPGSKLNMKLMLTTPWSKAAVVKVCDKTANSMFNDGSGKFYLVNDTKDTEMTLTTEDGIKYWTANITGNQDSLTFKYDDGSTNYTWTASGRGDNLVYNVFDYDSENGYGVWSPSPLQTETINIKDCIVGASLSTGTGSVLDSHIKVSTNGENYYRAAYNTTESKWYVNIDKDYLDKENPKLYIQYYNDDSALTAKWNATEGRPVDEETKEKATTYYLLDTDGKTTDYSTGSWTDTYNIYFYDGTAQQITSKANTAISYVAYSGEEVKLSGPVEQDDLAQYRFVAKGEFKYSDKINRVEFTLSRPTANGDTQKVTYTWNGDGKLNKDIYYTANSYTKD